MIWRNLWPWCVKPHVMAWGHWSSTYSHCSCTYCFASTMLSSTANYAQIDKEVLVFIFAVKKCNQYLSGHHFVIFTDHKPLLGLLHHSGCGQEACDGERPNEVQRYDSWGAAEELGGCAECAHWGTQRILDIWLRVGWWCHKACHWQRPGRLRARYWARTASAVLVVTARGIKSLLPLLPLYAPGGRCCGDPTSWSSVLSEAWKRWRRWGE